MKNQSFVCQSTITAFIFLFIASSIKTYAIDYNISFAGVGASTLVENVIVQNITKGTTVIVPSGNTLLLSDAANAIEHLYANDESISIYPNDEDGNFTMTFYAKQAGKTQIDSYSIDGKKLSSLNLILQEGVNSFQLKFAKGLYALQIIGNGYSYATKLLSNSKSNIKTEIIYKGIIKNHTPQKSKSTFTTMLFSSGDRIIYKGFSGNLITIVSEIPTNNKTVSFYFAECKDIDGNYYPIVKIGSQIWMAENLKTSHFRNNYSITNVTSDVNWGTITTSAYSDYNTPSKSTTYGKLYNWHAVIDNYLIAPLGWHIPTDAEWTTLTDFLGGESVAGNKLKENGPIHWGNLNASTNESGFTALPGGARTTDGFVYEIGQIGYWWSCSENNYNTGWYRYLDYMVGIASRGNYSKSGGMSVRCVKGDIQVLTTSMVTVTSTTTALCGGEISYDGGESISKRGVCWSTIQNPTILDSRSMDGSGIGAFTSSISELLPDTKYYIRAYATNILGTKYGNELNFRTTPIYADGFYISGEACAYSTLNKNGQMKATTLENNNNSARVGLNEKYIALEANKPFTITEVAGATKTAYGPGVGFATVVQAAVADEMSASIQKGKFAAGGTFNVPTSGLYHIVIDKQTMTVVIMPVSKWAVIGGATPLGWSDNDMPVKGSFSKDSIVFEIKDLTLLVGDFKFRHSGAWKQTIVADPLVKVNTNLGGTMAALVPGGANIPFLKADNGKYTVTVRWTKENGMQITMVKTGTVVVADYPANLYINGADFGGSTWDWASAGIVTMNPVHSHPNAFWAIVYVTADNGFKFAPGKAWVGDFGKTGTATNGVYGKGGDILTVVTTGYYMVYVDLKAEKVSVTSTTIYLIGDALNGVWDYAAGIGRFTVNNAAKTITSPAALKAGIIRMYATCELSQLDTPKVEWWQMEFNVIAGKIVYRGIGSDQSAVPITLGNKAVLNFISNTGVIQ